ncbi:DNA mismatch repair protein MSH5 [Ceratobasidium theobromae]|uniref:DNA mismatch repair protein MSH5 n=1 Tax=Ceratobasidium theobromae TaxID=1582974 RepID=A0A5N5QMV5_9AGAM|nr:DNA mismatch repair protein MSH5 [Ceratobasidium theobromae]
MAEKRKRTVISSDGESESSEERKRVRWDSEPSSPRSASEERSGSEETSDVKIFVTVTGHHGRIGGAYFNPENATLYLLEDTVDGSHFDLIRMFLEQTKADVCLVSSRADENLIIFCQEFMELAGGQCQVRPHREFVAQKGHAKLQQLRILSQLPRSEIDESNNLAPRLATRNVEDFIDSRRASDHDPSGQKLYAAIRRFNFGGDGAPLCLASVAALLEQLLRVHAAGELDEGQNHLGALNVDSIEILALDHVMQVNGDALAALQVFDDESHASVHSDRTKEGHSLFKLINHTSTHLGRSLLRRWCLRPSLSIPIITARHAALEFFLLAENISIAEDIRSNLRGLCQVPKAMALLRTGRGRLSEWRGIAKFACHVALLKEMIRNLGGHEDIGTICKFLEALEDVNAEETGVLINETIDWEESQNTHRVCINPNIDEALDEKKRIYNGLDDLLVQVARQVSQTIPEGYASELNVLYFPQLGQFKSNESAFYKSQQMHDLDVHVGDLHSWIADRYESSLHDKEIMAVCETAAEVDWLYEWVKPEMTEENVLDIQCGIHPLQNLLVPTFVPNDAYVIGGRGIESNGEDYQEGANSIVICTGANACGKSVYLKQNALIPLMAQIGCFVPAQSARLGIVDKIFTRLQTKETVSKLQSAFMIDLSQVSLALRNSTARSLLILDEFGKGSISTDGAGLFAGVISHLLKRGSSCPKVFASTHFHELFSRGLIDPELPISYAYMNILIDGGNHTGERRQQSEITYLYKITRGLCLGSYAAECARMYGLKGEVVERARFVRLSSVLSRNEVGRLLDEGMSEEECKELEERAEMCKRFVSWTISNRDKRGVKERLRSVLEG